MPDSSQIQNEKYVASKLRILRPIKVMIHSQNKLVPTWLCVPMAYFCTTPVSSSKIQNLLQMQYWALFAVNCILATKRPQKLPQSPN